ncbi:hypothetical protein NLG97_g3679 [Lecanicillium saksenae]|uniref:Uncharacterized protein n=1 Tax=Lecanicillium saksenae TaxID=468837 RepID=A0ACC1QYM5_9HYPO|nr:hypothetical protein NLG97_g3679 [Lecanicillium saksenae]
MTEQSFTMFLQQDDKDMTRYPEPSHNIAFTSASMEMSIAADAYSAYAGTLATTMGSLEQTMYSTSGPGQQGYPQPSGAPYQYSNQGPPHPGSGQQYSSSIQPQDPFYGRASPAGPPQPGYGAQGQPQQQQQQYDEAPPSLAELCHPFQPQAIWCKQAS